MGRKTLLAMLVAEVALLAFAGPAGAGGAGTLTMGPQSMEGNLIVDPGATIMAGYDFTIPGNHPMTEVTFVAPEVTFQAQCVAGSPGGSFVVSMPTQSYADPFNDGGDWFPSGDQQSSLVYQGQTTVPDLCEGGAISLAAGGTFTAEVQSSVEVPGDGAHVRWHYSANGSAGSWSGTAHVEPTVSGGGTGD